MTWRTLLTKMFGKDDEPAVSDLKSAGLKHLEREEFEQAIAVLSKAVEADPTSLYAISNLGAAYQLSGQTDAALQCFESCLSLNARYWLALINAGAIHLSRGDTAWVLSAVKRTEALDDLPASVVFLYARALIANESFHGSLDVLDNYRLRLQAKPEFWLLYGISCQFLNRRIEAEAAFRTLFRLKPGSPELQARYGRLLTDRGDHGGARAILWTAMDTPSHSIEALGSVARLLEVYGNLESGERALQAVLHRAPDNTEALTNLGNLKKKTYAFSEAEDLYRKAIACNANRVIAHKNLSDLLDKTLRRDEAIDEIRTCISIAPNNPYFHSDLIFSRHYSSEYTQEDLADEAHKWGRKHAPQRDSIRTINATAHASPLRIGLLSGSFAQHPVGFLALAGLEKLDPNKFSIVCFANQVHQDAYTHRFKCMSDRWFPVAHFNDRQLEALILDQNIDILVEMSGHAAGHRLQVVAKRVAPVQVKWIGGQFNTMGIPAIDYFLSDAAESPSSDQESYGESLYRLPDAYACYEPPDHVPGVGPLPAQTNGHLTFGSMNKINKVGPESIDLWSQCLHAVPGSRMVLQCEPFENQDVVNTLKAMLNDRGIEPHRIECRGFVPHPDFFETYNAVDIALDTHPYSGCLTTCEALWMGVPVVTLPGPSFAGRHSASFLTAVGLSEFIVNNENEYVALVSKLASDLDSLSGLRQSLRSRMAASPLCKADRFAENLADALQAMWAETVEHKLSA